MKLNGIKLCISISPETDDETLRFIRQLGVDHAYTWVQGNRSAPNGRHVMSRKSCSDSVIAGILGLVKYGTQSRYQQTHGETARTSYFGFRLAVHADRGADGGSL